MMHQKCFPVFASVLFFLSSGILYAGGVRGSVTNEAGDPLPFATIYVAENGSGTTTNEAGFYEIRLEPGDYNLVYRYLGYQSETRKVSIGESFKTLDLVLQEQPVQLQQVDVYEGREDPAYTVMRKAIAKAEFHRQQVERYTAQVYIKGSGRLLKSPFFLRKAIEKEGIDSTVAFTTESVSSIEYERPNTFRERVISVYQTGDANETDPNSFIFSSFYQPEIAEAISPLSPKAFAYYRFEFAGFFLDRDYGVNKIRVIPRSRGENVFEGYIYIVEDWWSIYSLDLKTYKFGIAFNVEQTYALINEKAWLPVSHQFDVEGKILGFAFKYDYLATISNYEIELNPDLDDSFVLIDEKLEKALAEEIEQQKKEAREQPALEEKLSSGEELTRKELRKLMREYEKEERRQEEEPEVVEIVEYSVDSLAASRDSTYWAEVRPVPLTRYEVRGYERQDSLAQVAEEEEAMEEADGSGDSGSGFQPFSLLGGRSYRVGEDHYFEHASFLDKIHFNPVEGFNVHTHLEFRNRAAQPYTVTLTPRYAFTRRRLSAKGQLDYRYGEKDKRGHLTLGGGRYIFQFNENNPLTYLFNTYLNLVKERNYLRLYEKEFAKLDWRQQLRENWNISAGLEWANRFTLQNNTTQTWFERDDRAYASNTPFSEELSYPLPARQQALFVTLGVETRPWQKYRIRNGNKEPIENTSPTLALHYRKGLPGLFDSDINYDRLEFSLRHHFPVGFRGEMDIKLETGLFLNNQAVGFPDFRHFAGNRITLVTADPVGSFRLLDYYRHSTQDQWAAAHVHYQFRKLLFTQIPEVWLLGIKENVFVNYLATPTSDNYFEVGYSLDNLLRFFRVEAAVSFQDGQYRDWGILIGIATQIGNSITIN